MREEPGVLQRAPSIPWQASPRIFPKYYRSPYIQPEYTEPKINEEAYIVSPQPSKDDDERLNHRREEIQESVISSRVPVAVRKEDLFLPTIAVSSQRQRSIPSADNASPSPTAIEGVTLLTPSSAGTNTNTTTPSSTSSRFSSTPPSSRTPDSGSGPILTEPESPTSPVISQSAEAVTTISIGGSGGGGVLASPSSLDSESQPLLANAAMAVTPESTTPSSAASASASAAVSPTVSARAWGTERTVELWREPNSSLGISIVGGKVDLFSMAPGSTVTGIFIKNVLPDSPAGRNGTLKTGDRILEVDGIDLRSASRERAVEVIRNAKNPVTFVVQSLIYWPKEPSENDIGSREATPHPPTPSPEVPKSLLKVSTAEWNDVRTPSPEIIQPGLSDGQKQELQRKIDVAKTPNVYDPSESESDDEAVTALEREETNDMFDDDRGKMVNRNGLEIDRASAGFLKLSTDDNEEEDAFGYTAKKVAKKYGDLSGTVVMVELQKGPNGVGLSLAGHRDRTQMHTFIVGLNPSGNAHRDGRIRIGDEILEVNGHVLHGRCHLNASAIIKGLAGNAIKLILLRRDDALSDLAVKPITRFPVQLGEEQPTDDHYSKYKEVRNVTLKKGPQGLGIMIIEGKHAEAGQGVFISDIREGGVAEQAGLSVGDMILAVNEEELAGADYDTAAAMLKKAEGLIRMVVTNPNKMAEIKSGVSGGTADSLARTPDKKEERREDKPSLPPKPPILAPKPSLIPSLIPRLSKTPSPTAPNVAFTPSSPVSTPSGKTTPSTTGPHITTIMVTVSPTTPSSTTASATTTPGTLGSSSPTPTSVVTSTTPVTCSISPSSGASKPPYKSKSPDGPGSDPSTCDIKGGRETTIEITKEKMGLGLSIVGGSDTLLGAIIIHEVYPDGAAAKDSRLRPGDQILEVNNENLREASHDRAIAALRQTPARVKMVVYREENQTREEDIYEILDVELVKKPGKGLGLSIVGRKNGPGVYVSDVVKGGVAEADGRLMQGDHILSVNGQDLKNAIQEQAATILKTTMGQIHMKIGRVKVSPHRAVSNGSSPKPNGTSDGRK